MLQSILILILIDWRGPRHLRLAGESAKVGRVEDPEQHFGPGADARIKLVPTL
jgi:hypothetical protein